MINVKKKCCNDKFTNNAIINNNNVPKVTRCIKKMWPQKEKIFERTWRANNAMMD